MKFIKDKYGKWINISYVCVIEIDGPYHKDNELTWLVNASLNTKESFLLANFGTREEAQNYLDEFFEV